VTLLLNRELVSRVKLCLVGVFPLLKDSFTGNLSHFVATSLRCTHRCMSTTLLCAGDRGLSTNLLCFVWLQEVHMLVVELQTALEVQGRPLDHSISTLDIQAISTATPCHQVNSSAS